MNQRSSVLVNIETSFTSDYCGGAPPGRQIIDRLKTPRPLRNEKLQFVDVHTDNIQSVLSDDEGDISINLIEGQYMIFFEEKTGSYPDTRFADSESCQRWRKKPDATLQITRENSTYQIKLHRTCSPCEPPKP